jgi:hypothetical protein
MLNTLYSRGAPRATPQMMRPFDRQSSIAISSASRSGSWIGRMLPYIRSFSFFVRCAADAAKRFGEFISP